MRKAISVEPRGQEPAAPMVRRNPPKLQSSFAKASEDTRIPLRSGDRGFLRRRVRNGPWQYAHTAFVANHEEERGEAMSNLKRTVLHDRHVALGAKIVEFGAGKCLFFTLQGLWKSIS